MKTIKIIFSCVIVGFVLMAVFTTNTDPEAVSMIDNRRLVKWKGDIDPYFQDRIGFRDRMIHGYTVYNDHVFNEMIHPLYEYGKNGHLFEKLTEEVYDSVHLDAFCSYLKRVQDYCEKRGAKFVFCLNPNKSTIYPQYLPEGYRFQAHFYQLVTERLRFYGIHYVDNVALLQKIGKIEQVFNYKYDILHWNDIGAYYGMNHLLEEMAKDFPAIIPWKLSDFEVQTVLRKNLPLSSLVIDEVVPKYVLRKNEAEETTERYDTLKIHPGYPVYFTYETDKADCPSVLFFQDSYCYSWNKFYCDRFKFVAGLQHCKNLSNFEYYFEVFKPDYVVIAAVERMLSVTFRLPTKEEFASLVLE
ncbi:MAG: hypothetical protein K2I87_04580 [Bacteroidales bacterium]|nr:hypothetical protein [Bacteroidales bacterium]